MVHGCAQVVYSHYTGDEVHDVFVLANLVADGFSPYQEGDLAVLRERWTEALDRRREHLTSQIQRYIHQVVKPAQHREYKL